MESEQGRGGVVVEFSYEYIRRWHLETEFNI